MLIEKQFMHTHAMKVKNKKTRAIFLNFSLIFCYVILLLCININAVSAWEPQPSFFNAKLKSVFNGVENNFPADLEITLSEFINYEKLKGGFWEPAGNNQWIYRKIFVDQLKRTEQESSMLFVMNLDGSEKFVVLSRWIDGDKEYTNDEIFILATLVSKEILAVKSSPEDEDVSTVTHPPDSIFEIYVSNNIKSINENNINKDDISYSSRDFNGDGIIDWSLWDSTKCGSGGCTGDVYISKNGKYCYAGYDNFNKILNSKRIIQNLDCVVNGESEIK